MINVTDLLDENRLSALQIRVFVLCALVALLDGYDSLVIGFTAHSIAADLRVSVATFGPIFAAVQVGSILGSFFVAPLGDRIGRKPVLIAAVLIFSVSTILTVYVGSITDLLILRICTGIGTGIASPLFVSLGADYAPKRLRGTIVTLFWIGLPLGSVLAGILGSLLITGLGWRSLYWIGGLAPLPIAILLVFALPESLTFLVTKDKDPARIRKIVRKIAPTAPIEETTTFATSEKKLAGVSVKHLFTAGNAVPTVLLWCAFFADYFVLHSSNTWPASLLRTEGMPTAQAALVTSFYAGGGIIGTLVVGYLLDRFGAVRVMGAGAMLGTLATASIGMFPHSFSFSCAALFVAGICIGGVGVALIVVAAKTYPTAVRSTGVGWALGVSRFSGLAAPLTIGMLVSQGWHIEGVFAACAIPALLTGVFAALLQIAQKRRDTDAEEEVPVPVG